MGHRYLKEVVKMQFPELQARAAAAEAEAAAREVRSSAKRACEAVLRCALQMKCIQVMLPRPVYRGSVFHAHDLLLCDLNQSRGK